MLDSNLTQDDIRVHNVTAESIRPSLLRLDSLQAARGVAAILVVFFHCNLVLSFPDTYGRAPLAGAFAFGNCGVTFFFVLSGFLMIRVHKKDIDKPQRVGRYLWRRFTRISPPYWVAFLLAAAVFLVLPRLGYAKRLNGLNAIFEWLLAPFPSITESLISVAWTLHREVLFYLAFAFLILSVRVGLALMGVWAVGILALNSYYGGDLPNHLGFYFDIRNLGFILGQLCGYFVSLRLGGCASARFCCIFGVVLFLGTGVTVDVTAAMWQSERPIVLLVTTLGYLLGASFSIIGFTRLEETVSMRVPAWLVWLGSASYSVYLIHMMVIKGLEKAIAVTRVSSMVPLNLMFLLLATTSIAVAFTFHVLVENPLVSCFSRFSPRSR